MKRQVHLQANDEAPLEGPYDFHGYTIWHSDKTAPFNAGLVEVDTKIVPVPVMFLRFLPAEENGRVVIAR